MITFATILQTNNNNYNNNKFEIENEIKYLYNKLITFRPYLQPIFKDLDIQNKKNRIYLLNIYKNNLNTIEKQELKRKDPNLDKEIKDIYTKLINLETDEENKDAYTIALKTFTDKVELLESFQYYLSELLRNSLNT
jgi:hypothetical protein